MLTVSFEGIYFIRIRIERNVLLKRQAVDLIRTYLKKTLQYAAVAIEGG